MTLQLVSKSDIIVEAKRLKIDLIGFASIDRFVAAPANHKPTDIMPEAQFVIALAQKCLTDIIRRIIVPLKQGFERAERKRTKQKDFTRIAENVNQDEKKYTGT